MSLRSSRGVQQDDVRQAADALIAEGLRPTIERVRQKIGRGSPNTVSPLLDTWFATLAGRLGVATEEGAKPPEPVQQAANQLWQAAMLSAREEAAQALAQAQQGLAAERADLEQRETRFEHQKQALAARQAAADDALQVARHQLGDMADRLEEAGLLLIRRDRDIDELQQKLTVRERERDAARDRSDEEAKRHAEERTRLEARATANERRLLEELDRERQDAKRMKTALIELERRAEAVHGKMEMANSSLGTELQAMKHALNAEQQALASANLRASGLRDALEAQKSVNATTLKQLNLLLASSARKPLIRPPIRRRR